MKNTLLLALMMASSSLFATNAFQYPEDRTYTNADQGYTQYGAPSLHHTGRYVLTFDDGPHPTRTAKVLDQLKKYNVKAMFFVITSQINDGNAHLIKRMLDEGHLVGSHGKNHDNSNTLDRAVFKARVKQSFIELAAWYKKAGYVLDKPFYRFPYAAYGSPSHGYHHMNVLKEISQELMGNNCIQFTFWDHDSGDWIPKMTGEEVAANIKATNEGGKFITYKTIRVNGRATQIKVPTNYEAVGGGVVLHHDIQQSEETGLPLVLQYYQDNNIQVLRLDEVDEFKVTKSCQMK